MKVIVAIIPTDLVINFLLSSFCPFLQTKNKNLLFSKLVLWWREIFLFFIYSELRSTSKPCRIQQTFIKEFSYMLFLFVLQYHGPNSSHSVSCCSPCVKVNSLNDSPFPSLQIQKKQQGNDKENRKIQQLLLFTVCFNVNFTDNWQNLLQKL